MNLESIGDLVLTDEVDKFDIKFRTSKGRSHEKIIFCYFLLNKAKIVQTKYVVIYVMLRPINSESMNQIYFSRFAANV